MPELPEVEHARCTLADWLAGHRISRCTARPGKPLRQPAPRLVAGLEGATAGPPLRHGKHLLVPLSRAGKRLPALHLHLGMTGRLVVTPRGTPVPRFAKLSLSREDGVTVHLCDSRRFGVAELVDDSSREHLAGRHALGLDPTHDRLDAAALAALLAGQRRAVKDLLMDQSRIAGIGNLYATEALWRACVHPARPGGSLTPEEVARVAASAGEVLQASLKSFASLRRRQNARFRRGDAAALAGPLYVEEGAENPFDAYGRTGHPCRRCGTELADLAIAGRTSVYCSRCQPRPARVKLPARRASGRRPRG